MKDQGNLIWLVALEKIVSFATQRVFQVQPSTETSLFLHKLFCFVKVLFYFVIGYLYFCYKFLL